MSIKLNLCLLTSLALLQCSLGAIRVQDTNTLFQTVPTLEDIGVTLPPKTSNEDSLDPISDYDEPNEWEKLYTYALAEYYQLVMKTLMNGKEMLEDIVGSLTVLKGKNKKLSAKVEEFSDLISKVEEIEEKHRKGDGNFYQAAFNLFETFSTYLEACNATAMENPSAEDLLLDILLEKYGISEIDDIYWMDFWNFMHKILVAAEQYWSTLSPEEQAEDVEFREWLMQHRAAEETDLNNKMELYRKFFQLFEE